jgi:hypothetical protein
MLPSVLWSKHFPSSRGQRGEIYWNVLNCFYSRWTDMFTGSLSCILLQGTHIHTRTDRYRCLCGGARLGINVCLLCQHFHWLLQPMAESVCNKCARASGREIERVWCTGKHALILAHALQGSQGLTWSSLCLWHAILMCKPSWKAGDWLAGHVGG